MPINIYRGSTHLPAQGNGKGADTEEMLSTASQLWRWAKEPSSGCWGVEQKLIWQTLGYSWVFWEKGKKLAHSCSSLILLRWLFLSPRDPFGQREGVGRVTELPAKQVQQQSMEERRSNVLTTPLAQTELWGCMTKSSGRSCHTRSLPLGKRIYIFV